MSRPLPVYRFNFVGGPMDGKTLASDSDDSIEWVTAGACWKMTRRGQTGEGFLLDEGSGVVNYEMRHLFPNLSRYVVTDSWQWNPGEITVTVEYRR